MNIIKTSVKRIFRKIFRGGYVNSDDLIKHLRKKGVQIGENCVFYDCNSVSIDAQNPCMLTIGNYVRITSGVQILTHDYSFSVLSAVEGGIVGSVEKTSIGNNVFIGRNAIILKGVSIGDNVIIGAGSIVSKNCDSNSVYAGNPARKISSIESMYEKRKAKMLENARKLACCYYEQNNKIPTPSVLREYQILFEPRDNVPESLKALMKDSGNYEKCLNYFKSTEPYFKNYEEFLKWCGLLGAGGSLGE